MVPIRMPRSQGHVGSTRTVRGSSPRESAAWSGSWDPFHQRLPERDFQIALSLESSGMRFDGLQERVANRAKRVEEIGQSAFASSKSCCSSLDDARTTVGGRL